MAERERTTGGRPARLHGLTGVPVNPIAVC